MTLRIIKGDIFDPDILSKNDAFIHLANCFNRMGTGVAKGVADYMPALRAVDSATVAGDMDKLGSHTSVKVLGSGYEIMGYNVYGQYEYGRNAPMLDDVALQMALNSLREPLAGKKVVMPKIGTKNAGGNWDHVRNIIEVGLSKSDITIVDYT